MHRIFLDLVFIYVKEVVDVFVWNEKQMEGSMEQPKELQASKPLDLINDLRI